MGAGRAGPGRAPRVRGGGCGLSPGPEGPARPRGAGGAGLRAVLRQERCGARCWAE